MTMALRGRPRRAWQLVVVLLAAGVIAPNSGDAERRPSSSELEEQLRKAETEVAEYRASLASREARRTQIDSEVEGLQERHGEAFTRLQSRARTLYRLRRSGMLPVAGGFDALIQHLGRLNRLMRMLRDESHDLSLLKGRMTALRAEHAALSEALATDKNALLALSIQVEELRQQRQDDLQRQRALQGQDSSQDRGPVYGRIRVRDTEQSAFEGRRGKLAQPVSGMQRYELPSDPNQHGLRIIARAGAGVRAVSDGRVAFARNHSEHGRMVIVDHGDSYYSVYGGLRAVDVAEDDWVGSGARLGSLPHEPEASLYFEVRRGTRALDAKAWLGL